MKHGRRRAMHYDRKKTLLFLACLAVAAVVAYLPALGAGFIWDDDAYVENNENLRSLQGLGRIWFEPLSSPQYYPLVHTTYWLEYHLWGLKPLGYHLDNLLLHLTSCGLLFLLVRRLALPGAVLIAGLFALHPVMVESVAWVTERKNVLSMVLYLAAMLAYLRFAGLDRATSSEEDRSRGPIRFWVLSFILFAGALASKSVTFSLPFTLLLITWWKRGRLAGRDFRDLLPFIVVGAAYGAYTSHLEVFRVGAVGPEWDQSLAERFLIAGRVPWFYLGKLLFPHPLTFIYERWEVDAAAGWQYLFPLATLILLGGLGLLAWKRGCRGPLAAVLMFGGTLFPALGFIDVYPFRYSFVADHFQYHAALGILVLIGAGLSRWIPLRTGLPLALVVLGLFGVRTFFQCQKYESREVLYNSILDDNPDGWFAHNNLAAVYVTRGEYDRAFASYAKAHDLRPIIEPAASSEAYAHAQIGTMIAQTWSLQPVLDLVRRRADPAEVIARRSEVVGHIAEAEGHLRKSIAASPGYADPHVYLGMLMQGMGMVTIEDAAAAQNRFRRAVEEWHEALRIDPRNRDVRVRLQRLHSFLAENFARQGHGEAAQAHREAARHLIQTDPGGR